MRELKFKAKRIDNGEWAYFNLFGGGINAKDYYFWDKKHEYSLELIPFVVDEETVCQATGITDSQGNDIYEGDYVQWGDDDEPVVECVTYHDKEAAFLTETSCLDNDVFLLTGKNIHDKD